MPGQLIAPKDRPLSPTFLFEGEKYADCRVYMVVERIDFQETVVAPAKTSRVKSKTEPRPIIFHPPFFDGIEALRQGIDNFPEVRRTHVVVELSDLAVRLSRALMDSQPRRRGRPS